MTPSNFDDGPTGLTFQRINSEQKPVFVKPWNAAGGQQLFGVEAGLVENPDEPGDFTCDKFVPGKL